MPSSSLRQAWETILPADYELHMASAGQAAANARLLARWLQRFPEPASLLIPGAGPGQFLDAVPLSPHAVTCTDINPFFLATLSARLRAKEQNEATVLADDLEASALRGPFALVALVLVLEHVDWRRALGHLRRWQTRHALLVIQENPPGMASAVTPGVVPPGTMRVFADEVRPHLLHRPELDAFLAAQGYAVEGVDTEETAHGKRMRGLHVAASYSV